MTPEQAREEQRAVVDHAPNIVVRACPGAGKTRVAVDRFLRVAREEGPVAVISFTNRAADEIAARSSDHRDPALVQFPNFIGTFDRFVASFIVRPFGKLGGPIQIVDSWATLDAVVRSRGLRGEISLDHFEVSPDGVVRYQRNPADPRVDDAVRSQVETNARRTRDELINRGYLTCDDAKRYALRLLGEHEIIARLLRERFREIIVDEAQDCSTTELRILGELHDAGVPLVVVADPNQAIYGWRDADIDEFENLAERLESIQLTGNWRNSSKICSLAATLRSGPADHAIDDPDDARGPIRLVGYSGAPTRDIGDWFAHLAEQSDIPRNEAIVLAHRAATAARVAGASSTQAGSRLATFARAGHRLREPGLSPTERKREVATIERHLLRFVGVETQGLTTRDAIEQGGVDITWLRSAAIEVMRTMASLDFEMPCDDWADHLRRGLRRAGAMGKLKPASPKVFLKTPQSAKGTTVATLVGAQRATGLRSSTIHAAKGTEVDAAIVVVDRDRGQSTRTRDLLDDWESGTVGEPQRVLYVGITRSRYLCALAVPAEHLCQVKSILDAGGVVVDVAEL